MTPYNLMASIEKLNFAALTIDKKIIYYGHYT